METQHMIRYHKGEAKIELLNPEDQAAVRASGEILVEAGVKAIVEVDNKEQSALSAKITTTDGRTLPPRPEQAQMTRE